MEQEESQELTVVDEKPIIGVLTEAEKADAVQRVQASFVIAKRFPRDDSVALTRIRKSCQRLSLAEVALYSYPRGGQNVQGPSIRLAEVIAQSWGNLDFGIRELEHFQGLQNGRSVVEAYCTDLETNTHQRRVFTVHHKMETKKGMKFLTSPRDIYEHVANYGARRMRACILGVIPRDVVEAAVTEVNLTLKKGGGQPLVDRIRQLVFGFSSIGVSSEMIERKLGHKTELITDGEIVELRAVFNALKDGEAKRTDYFDFGAETTGGKAEELNSRGKKK